MKHNQKDETSKQQSKEMPKNQQGNNVKSTQHGSSDREHQDDHQMGKQGSKKHAEEGKTR